MKEAESTRQERIGAMRRILDFLEANPEFPEPHSLKGMTAYVSSIDAKQNIAKCARMLGTFEKSANAADFIITRDFGGAYLTAYTSRSNVCEKKLVTETVTHEVWECPDSLLEFEAAVEA